MIPHLDTLAGPNLELPLRWHHLCVNTADIDTGVQACAVVGLDQISREHLASAYTAVVRALRSRETALGPTKRRAICVKEGILLLETKPGDVFLGKLHRLGSEMAVVGAVGSPIAVVSFSKHKDVATTPEWVLEDGCWSKIYIGIMPWSLVGGRPVEIPYAKLGDVFDVLGYGHGFGAQATVTIDPDIFRLNFTALVELKVGCEEVRTSESHVRLGDESDGVAKASFKALARYKYRHG